MDAVNLTPDDLTHNHQGVISSQQIHLLRQQRLVSVAGTAVFLLLILLLLLALLLKFQIPTFADKGQLFLLFPLGLFWLWLLRPSPQRWQRINRDLKKGKVAFVEGSVHHAFGSTMGLIQLVKYEIHVGEHRFRVRKEVCFQFKSDRPYRVYYSPHAGVFLGAVALAPEKIFAEPAPVISDQYSVISKELSAEALNPREVELLRLIAAGLSNKEIADQLSLSVNTVKMYTSQMYQKLGVRRRTEAVSRGRDLGIL